jgi:hypothetical protein
MNTHVRDNFNYLKGNAGAVVISDTLQATQLGVGVAASASYAAYINSGALPTRIERSGSAGSWLELRSASQDATNKWSLRIRDLAEGDFSIYDMTAADPRLYINSIGNVGIGVTAPKGRFHAFDTESGAFLWRNTAVAGSTVAVLAAGAVVAGVSGLYVVYDGSNRSSGSIPNVAATGTLAVTHTLHTGTGTYVLHVNANGSVDVQRTSGSGTGQISLWLLYH